MTPDPLPLLPAWADLERRYIILAHAARVARLDRRSTPKGGAHGKPVISNRGEWYPSGTAAAMAHGLYRTALANAITRGSPVAGRRWRFATAAESRRHGARVA